jgi:hypothetical protein
MESSNFNSNVLGGASKFRRLQQAAADAAPAEVAKKIRNLPFQANAAGVHRHGVSVLLSAHQPPKQERGVFAQLLAASARCASTNASEGSSQKAAATLDEASPAALLSMPRPAAQPVLVSPTLAQRVCDFDGPPLAVLMLAANMPSSDTAVAGAYIRRCWRRAALALHPDKDKTSDPHRMPAFHRITAAYNELCQLHT